MANDSDSSSMVKLAASPLPLDGATDSSSLAPFEDTDEGE
jgi:hypothetical protein